MVGERSRPAGIEAPAEVHAEQGDGLRRSSGWSRRACPCRGRSTSDAIRSLSVVLGAVSDERAVDVDVLEAGTPSSSMKMIRDCGVYS